MQGLSECNSKYSSDEVKSTVGCLYQEYANIDIADRSKRKKLRSEFTSLLRRLYDQLPDYKLKRDFANTMARLHLYAPDMRLLPGGTKGKRFNFFNPQLFHKPDPKCAMCGKILNEFNTVEGSDICNDCGKG